MRSSRGMAAVAFRGGADGRPAGEPAPGLRWQEPGRPSDVAAEQGQTSPPASGRQNQHAEAVLPPG